MNQEMIDKLLYEDESAILDFKEDQYKFIRASAKEKSELLKDILSFANAWRRSDAYILVGVKERKTGKSEIIGIMAHLDDASIQQFVNSKTQKPCDFSYLTVKTDSGDVGVIRIPVQGRPIYLRQDYGKLKKDVVYVRRGSSCDIASPDEISKMGAANISVDDRSPVLDLAFYDSKNDKVLGKEIAVQTVNLIISDYDSIPDYGRSQGLGLGLSIPNPMANKSYYRELVNYLIFHKGHVQINLALTNSSEVVAGDIRVEMQIIDETGDLEVIEDADEPSEPSPQFSFSTIQATGQYSSAYFVEKKEHYKVYCTMDRLHAKRILHLPGYISLKAGQSKVIDINAKIFANRLRGPIEQNLRVDMNVENIESDWASLRDKIFSEND